MSISNVVAAVAEVLEVRAPVETKELLASLRRMPDHVRLKDLARWDDSVRDAAKRLAGSTDAITRLAVELVKLATDNMYAAIDAGRTERAYAELVTRAGTLGISLPSSVDLSDW